MSNGQKNGPYGRYAVVRGTGRDVLLHLRRGDWTRGVDELAVKIGRPVNSVYVAIAELVERELVNYHKGDGGSMRFWLTRTGRAIRL